MLLVSPVASQPHKGMGEEMAPRKSKAPRIEVLEDAQVLERLERMIESMDRLSAALEAWGPRASLGTEFSPFIATRAETRSRLSHKQILAALGHVFKIVPLSPDEKLSNMGLGIGHDAAKVQKINEYHLFAQRGLSLTIADTLWCKTASDLATAVAADLYASS